MEEGSDYYVVRKGDTMAVYRSLNECKAQICSSLKVDRAWMYDAPRCGEKYIKEVSNFIQAAKKDAFSKKTDSKYIRCPCVDCKNLIMWESSTIQAHLIMRGFVKDYTCWSEHGEKDTLVSGPAASVYKGYSWSKDKEEYLSSHGLSNAAYAINAAELREDVLGPLVSCNFHEIIGSNPNQPVPNDTGFLGFNNGIRYQTGSQSIDLNHMPLKDSGNGSMKNQSLWDMFPLVMMFQKDGNIDAGSSSSSRLPPHTFNHSRAVDAQPVSRHMVGILHFDGASKGNPGKGGAGAVLMAEDGRVISRLREGLGVVTNNVAEYRGLILGLKYAITQGFEKIKVNGDSQLVCYQVGGIWQVRKQNMMELCNEVRKLKEKFQSFEINHVRRELNAEADRQANIGVTLASGTVSEERGDGF
ncbi:hypothetical protein ACP70R_019210 [Stipagrostis hirtigluma subsp. patula]